MIFSNINVIFSNEVENQDFNFMSMNVVNNIKEIRLLKSINQEVIADALGVDVSVISNIEKGKRELKVNELEKIANCLSVDVLYLFTYPHIFVNKLEVETSERVSVTFEVAPEKRDYLLKLVTGGN